jgi:hypothetical protein
LVFDHDSKEKYGGNKTRIDDLPHLDARVDGNPAIEQPQPQRPTKRFL